MQANLRSLLAGKREAVELPPKRGPGRPPKRKRDEEKELPDEVLQALRSIQEHHEAYDEHIVLSQRWRTMRRRRMLDGEGSRSIAAAWIEAGGALR